MFSPPSGYRLALKENISIDIAEVRKNPVEMQKIMIK